MFKGVSDWRKWMGGLSLLLPASAVFGFGMVWPTDGASSAGAVRGRPAGGVFGAVWTLLVLLWGVAGAAASLHFAPVSLALFQLFSVAALACAVLWLYLYNGAGDKAAAAQVLLLALLFACLALVACLTADAPERVLAALAMTPLPVWLLAAALFNYLELNAAERAK
jgi:tryptophan-rich sensory protein